MLSQELMGELLAVLNHYDLPKAAKLAALTECIFQTGQPEISRLEIAAQLRRAASLEEGRDLSRCQH